MKNFLKKFSQEVFSVLNIVLVIANIVMLFSYYKEKKAKAKKGKVYEIKGYEIDDDEEEDEDEEN